MFVPAVDYFYILGGNDTALSLAVAGALGRNS